MRDVLSFLSRPGQVLLSTVSGVASTTPGMISYFDQKVKAVSIVTTKSFQVNPNSGNPEPIICETSLGNFGNSVGLRNSGMAQALDELKELRRKSLRIILNVSLSANCPEDFVILVKAFAPYADMLELNFSCPHAAVGYGASIGCDGDIASEYVTQIRAAVPDLAVPLFIKLTPNVKDIGSIAKAVLACGADGLVAINTVGPIVHIDPASGRPILQNQLGGKGGCSGSWVFEKALASISAIRKAVGPSVPVLGMGGVFTGSEAARLIECGANVVGIGSALAMVSQKQWPQYLQSIKNEAQQILAGEHPELVSKTYLRTERRMAYVRHLVTEVQYYGEDTMIMQCDGKLESKAGQFVFLWLPSHGEKPFSVATTEPLSFVIKRRGPFTDELFKLKEGDELYIRGLYGAPLENKRSAHALLLAGGTGVAVLPMLCKQLEEQGTVMTILVGTSVSVSKPALLEKELRGYGSFSCVPDNGKPGRILDKLDALQLDEDTAVYLIGPEPFMAGACRKLLALGAKKDKLYLSMERMTRCGVGLCGECGCAGRLTCQWGTFMEYEYLETEAPKLLGL